MAPLCPGSVAWVRVGIVVGVRVMVWERVVRLRLRLSPWYRGSVAWVGLRCRTKGGTKV